MKAFFLKTKNLIISKEIPLLLRIRNPVTVHNSTPPDPIMSQLDSIFVTFIQKWIHFYFCVKRGRFMFPLVIHFYCKETTIVDRAVARQWQDVLSLFRSLTLMVSRTTGWETLYRPMIRIPFSFMNVYIFKGTLNSSSSPDFLGYS
jgi:hypothetical protein